jgi:hypothetical protein
MLLTMYGLITSYCHRLPHQLNCNPSHRLQGIGSIRFPDVNLDIPANLSSATTLS